MSFEGCRVVTGVGALFLFMAGCYSTARWTTVCLSIHQPMGCSPLGCVDGIAVNTHAHPLTVGPGPSPCPASLFLQVWAGCLLSVSTDSLWAAGAAVGRGLIQACFVEMCLCSSQWPSPGDLGDVPGQAVLGCVRPGCMYSESEVC